jgi:hypothetical protein
LFSCRVEPTGDLGISFRDTVGDRGCFVCQVLPRKGHRVGLRIVLFEACSAFTRVAACTLARSPIRDPLPEGFSHFVASMTAPVASGWSGCRVGLAPTGKRRLFTAHTRPGHRSARANSSCHQDFKRFRPRGRLTFHWQAQGAANRAPAGCACCYHDGSPAARGRDQIP